MVTSLTSQRPTKRKAWFLRPISDGHHPFSPSHYKPISVSPADAPPIQFKGWFYPQRRWSDWVSKLEPTHGESWRKAGIFEAIKASTYSIRRDPSSVLGVAGFWCQETNTFIFPWGEATVTLEDVRILGGFSVLGEPVRCSKPLEGDLGELERMMNKERREFSKGKGKKASHGYWLNRYIEGNGGEIEHIAFLILWLSRFVFPARPFSTVSKHVIPIAIRLAQGARIALAPAVLGTLYRGLRAVKKHLKRGHDSELTVWAPLQILQLWVWERFMALRPKLGCYVNWDEPRPARWNNVGKTLDFSFVVSVIESPDEFLWRPYVTPLDHWRNPCFYRDGGEWVYGNAATNEGLGVLACCLRASELVGLDCIEQYLPHRVSLQFGLDQDVTDYVPRVNSTWEVAWETYDVRARNVLFYVPPRLIESDVSLRYAIWWKSIKELLEKKKKKKRKTQDQCHRRMKKLRHLYDMPSPGNGCSTSMHERPIEKQVDAGQASIYKTMNQSEDVQRENGLEKGLQWEEVAASGASDIDKGIQEDARKYSMEESSDDLIIIDLEEVDVSEAKSKTEEKGQTEVTGKKVASETEIKRFAEERKMEIERSKKEIKLLEAKIKELQAKV